MQKAIKKAWVPRWLFRIALKHKWGRFYWAFPSSETVRTASMFLDNPIDEQILRATGHWMLACAVGAQNGTLSTTGSLDFNTWFEICRGTWVARVSKELGVDEKRIRSVIQSYAQRNAYRSYREVFQIEKLIHPDQTFEGK